MNIKTLLLYVALLFPQYSTAQQVRDFTYSHIGQEEGLGNQRIYTIRQTDDKALWWSTKEGVDRYNGVSVKHYEIGNSAVFGNYAGRITKLAEVTDGALIAFDNKGGVYDYDKVQDRFVLRIDLSSLFKSDVLLNDLLAVDNGLWLAMREGVYYLQEQTLAPVLKDVYTSTIIKGCSQLYLCTREGVLVYNLQNGSPKAGMKLQRLVPA